jgi:hypothetical protein
VFPQAEKYTHFKSSILETKRGAGRKKGKEKRRKEKKEGGRGERRRREKSQQARFQP